MFVNFYFYKIETRMDFMKELTVLAINGSPHSEGGTFQAINIVAKDLCF